MSSNLIYLQAVRKKKACMMELNAQQHSLFTCVEEMNSSINRFLEERGTELSDTALILLAVLSQHSCVVPGVSWLSVRSMASLVGVTDRTVQIALKAIEKTGILLRISTTAENGAQGNNYVAFQVYRETESASHEESVAIQELLAATRETAAAGNRSTETFTGGNRGKFTQNSLNSLNSKTKEVCMNTPKGVITSSVNIFESIKTYGSEVILSSGVENYQGVYVLGLDDQSILEIASMLPKKFPNQINQEVIQIACSVFIRKFYQAQKKNRKFTIQNPVGWFMFSYEEAIKEYKIKLKAAI
ncbi:MAG: hypothetical protein ACE3L7_32140 [Candidatus Pristimantibacillus sp.]